MNLRLTPRLYNENSLTQDGSVTVTEDQAHYLQNVMRMKTGESLRLFNAQDGEWHGVITAMAKRSLTVKFREQLRAAAAEQDLCLACAPIKKVHFDFMIEKATELGVTSIQPIFTARTQIREVNIDRCRAIAIEAAEQSERLSIPKIHKPLSLKNFADSWSQDRTLIVCAELGTAQPAGAAFTALKPRATTIITGPEGGFAAEELDMLRQIPHAVFIRLGPRILRADTAALAALSVWQAVGGDWTSA